MANLTLTNDLIADGLFKAAEPTDGTSDFHSQTLAYLNRGYEVIWSGGSELDPETNETWWWLLATAPGTLVLQPKIDGGTVAVTNNNATITLSSSPAQDLTQYHFKVNDHADVFRVSSHAGATEVSITLDSVYTGQTASEASFKLFRVEYDLATDVLTLSGPMRVYRGNREEIEGTSEASLDRDWPLSRISGGTPREFAQIGEQRVRFSHYAGASSGDLTRVDYSYMRIPPLLATGATDAPIMPIRYRYILSDYLAYRLLVDKADTDAERYGLEARNGIRAMSQEHRRRMSLTRSRMGEIITRPGQTERHQRPPRTEAGLIIG